MVVMKKIFIFFIFCLFIIGCGEPRFEINEEESKGETFTITYFFPTTEYAKNMKAEMPIIIIFSENIEVDSAMKGLSIEKTGPGQKQNIKPKCDYNESERMLQCLPESGRWEFKSNYSIKIKDVKSRDGKKSLDKEYTFVFSTI